MCGAGRLISHRTGLRRALIRRSRMAWPRPRAGGSTAMTVSTRGRRRRVGGRTACGRSAPDHRRPGSQRRAVHRPAPPPRLRESASTTLHSRGVVRFEHAGRPTRAVRCAEGHLEQRFDLFGRNAAWPKHLWRIDGAVDDRRFDADRARAAVEHEVDIVAEVGANVIRSGRADTAEAVRRRCGESSAEPGQQFQRQRMSGHTHADGCRARR